MEGHANITPPPHHHHHHSRSLIASYGVLPRIWSLARPYGGAGVDPLLADMGGWEGVASVSCPSLAVY